MFGRWNSFCVTVFFFMHLTNELMSNDFESSRFKPTNLKLGPTFRVHLINNKESCFKLRNKCWLNEYISNNYDLKTFRLFSLSSKKEFADYNQRYPSVFKLIRYYIFKSKREKA